ncbi:hypothetical protein T552_04091 [Pneumocystis carinii B80]|uniref:ribonuclease H n=1 Tax=Pneumocystis carinii (strain B80) TaxID=1408658 RepID=A0A0W4ZMQ7_PNEC8|nr:hypothetical protein T552_04091 [Pneumocystis carinii B80]KTW29658.1 hypothetical protein T552_04091 [Pneumocystis carinii B80]
MYLVLNRIYRESSQILLISARNKYFLENFRKIYEGLLNDYKRKTYCSSKKDIDKLDYELKCIKKDKTNIYNSKEKKILEKDYIEIYTDGSSHYYGEGKVIAGIGVYFGDNDKRKVLKERIYDIKQTNQRAEIMAIIRAIESVSNDENIIINTDSKYAINSLTIWYKKWEKNNWKNINAESVKNKDLLEKALELIKKRSGFTELKYVSSHGDIYGNKQADYLANKSIFMKKKV